MPNVINLSVAITRLGEELACTLTIDPLRLENLCDKALNGRTGQTTLQEGGIILTVPEKAHALAQERKAKRQAQRDEHMEKMRVAEALEA